MQKFIKEIANKSREGYQFPVNEYTGNWCSEIFPPSENEVYKISRWFENEQPAKEMLYAGGKVVAVNENVRDNLFAQELRVFLLSSDWCKFQAQPFYQDLMQYLDSLKTQKAEGHLDELPD